MRGGGAFTLSVFDMVLSSVGGVVSVGVYVWLWVWGIPNKILVYDSLSYIMKLCENLKLAMQRHKVAFPSEDIDDPSPVLRCTAAGSILVL